MARRVKKKNRLGSISGYSPRGKVQTFLYTKGNEFSLDGIEYVGEYHIKEGIAYTGPEPLKALDDINKVGDPDIIQREFRAAKTMNSGQILRRIYTDFDQYEYDRLKKFDIRELDFLEPRPYLYKPKDAAYDAGEDSRYFVQKRHSDDSYPMEIDLSQWELIGQFRGIDPQIYASVSVVWKLVGSFDYIAQQKELELLRAQKLVPGVLYAVKSFTEFARLTRF